MPQIGNYPAPQNGPNTGIGGRAGMPFQEWLLTALLLANGRFSHIFLVREWVESISRNTLLVEKRYTNNHFLALCLHLLTVGFRPFCAHRSPIMGLSKMTKLSVWPNVSIITMVIKTRPVLQAFSLQHMQHFQMRAAVEPFRLICMQTPVMRRTNHVLFL